MNQYERDRTYDESHKTIDYTPTFNSSSKLEFNILPDKRFLSLRDSILFFTVDIPDFMVPDNFFGNALFECIDLYINHELVTSKASNADNYLSDYFISRQIYNEPFSNTANAIYGCFNDSNLDASEMTSMYTNSRRKTAKSHTISSVKYYRYELCVPLNLGLGNRKSSPITHTFVLSSTRNTTTKRRSYSNYIQQSQCKESPSANN